MIMEEAHFFVCLFFTLQIHSTNPHTPGVHTYSQGVEDGLQGPPWAALFPPATYPLSSGSPASFQWQSFRGPHPAPPMLPAIQWFYGPQGRNLCMHPITHPVGFAPTALMSGLRWILMPCLPKGLEDKHSSFCKVKLTEPGQQHMERWSINWACLSLSVEWKFLIHSYSHLCFWACMSRLVGLQESNTVPESTKETS